jgi:hypothetical protein
VKDTQRPPIEPTDLVDWLWYVRRYEDAIFVREQIDGHWESPALSSLSPERWAHHVVGWLNDGVLPVRVLEEEERHASPSS